MNNLINKTALVTGAGSGIGHAICKTLADMGATVIAVARNKETLQQLESVILSSHKFWSIDLSAKEGHDQLLNNLEGAGFPHIVVCNLHIPIEKKRVINTTKAAFSENFTNNIDHLFAIMEKTLQFQRQEKFGRWIGLSSLAASTGFPGQVTYNAQKSAMEAVFYSLATEEGKYGITANLIAPGVIITPSVETRIPKEMLDRIAANNAMKRAGTPEDVAAAAGFFASPGASFITGAKLAVSGGAELAWKYM